MPRKPKPRVSGLDRAVWNWEHRKTLQAGPRDGQIMLKAHRRLYCANHGHHWLGPICANCAEPKPGVVLADLFKTETVDPAPVEQPQEKGPDALREIGVSMLTGREDGTDDSTPK